MFKILIQVFIILILILIILIEKITILNQVFKIRKDIQSFI